MGTAQRIRVTIFKPHRVYRECLQDVLNGAGMMVVGGYGDASSFLANLPVDRPDVAVADFASCSAVGTGQDARSLLHELHEKHPGLALVVLSDGADLDPEYCYREGVSAYVYTHLGSTAELVRAVQAATKGVRLFPFDVASTGFQTSGPSANSPLLDMLSFRERQVLTFIGAGADNLKISAQLGISERTVKSHVTNLYRKTQVENRTQLAILAREVGLRPLPTDGVVRAELEAKPAGELSLSDARPLG